MLTYTHTFIYTYLLTTKLTERLFIIMMKKLLKVVLKPPKSVILNPVIFQLHLPSSEIECYEKVTRVHY